MARISKQERKVHEKVMELINSDRPLTYEEKEFCLENYQGDGTGFNGAFFTPSGLAWDFSVDAYTSGTVIDLCAGIGRLAFSMYHRCKPKRIVCVELNNEYARIGKRILPEAEWIVGDALSYIPQEKFDVAISNPPFGKINTTEHKDVDGYTGGEFEFKVMTHARKFADVGYFIVPQGSAGFTYSGKPYYDGTAKTNKYIKWEEQTGLCAYPGCGVDTSYYRDQWHGTNVICEVVEIRYYEHRNQTPDISEDAPKTHSNEENKSDSVIALPEPVNSSGTLTDLFDI